MLNFITEQGGPLPTILFKEPVFWKIEPQTAAAITGKDDALPISWAVIYESGKPENAIILAVFGLWVVAWQLPESTLSLNQSLANWLDDLVNQASMTR
jgi:PIN domain nuclease of toxin-antitoxin system